MNFKPIPAAFFTLILVLTKLDIRKRNFVSVTRVKYIQKSSYLLTLFRGRGGGAMHSFFVAWKRDNCDKTKHDRNVWQKSMTEKRDRKKRLKSVTKKYDRKVWQKRLTKKHDRKA